MSVFVHAYAQGIKNVPAWGGLKKGQNSVNIVVEWPLGGENWAV